MALHVCRFGHFELAPFTGNPVRRCLEPTGPGQAPCRAVSMDGDEEAGEGLPITPRPIAKPTPLKVARAERDEARSEAALLKRVLHDLASGRTPDAVEAESRPDGWTVKATLYRCQSGEGGLLLIQEADSDGKPCDTRAAYFEAWRDSLNAAPSEYNTTERLVAERIGSARWKIWNPDPSPTSPKLNPQEA